MGCLVDGSTHVRATGGAIELGRTLVALRRLGPTRARREASLLVSTDHQFEIYGADLTPLAGLGLWPNGARLASLRLQPHYHPLPNLFLPAKVVFASRC